MNRLLLTLGLVIPALMLRAEEAVEYPAQAEEASVLVIYGTADHAAITPMFDAFRQRFPSVRINYTEFSTLRLNRHFLDTHPDNPDLVMSPAMDLQVRLVNDGYAMAYRSVQTQALPDWAKWRDEIFGFTYEPIVIALGGDLASDEEVPDSRAELLELIRREGGRLKGRIGLVDIETVGLGYLVWSHDSQQSRIYGQLLEVFGTHQARRYPNNTAMLRALAEGEILIAYNALGSYAEELARQNPAIKLISPSDYTSVVMRSAFIPRHALNPGDARRFLDFLLSPEGQQVLADSSSLVPIRGEVTGADGLSPALSTLRPIPLGLELLLHTDQARRRLLLAEWRAVMGPGKPVVPGSAE